MRFLVPQNEAEWAERRSILEACKAAPDDLAVRAEVNSGRMAEAFWYVTSPLTTPCAAHVFPGRPPKGEDPVPAPGVIAPDVEVTLGSGDKARIRSLARRGMLVLVGADLDAAEMADALSGLRCPVTVLSLSEVDPDGSVAGALDATPGEVWIIRPDAHIAAAATSVAAAIAAAYTVLGMPSPATV